MTVTNGVQPQDYHRTRAALVAIPEMVTMLQTELIEGHQPSSSRTKPGSRPPAPIGLLSDLDEAWNVLTTWTRDWCETFDFSAPAPYWPDVCEFLARHWPNMAEQHPAASDFADEVAGVGQWRTSVWVLLSRHTVEGQPSWRKLPGRWNCPVPLNGGDSACDGVLLQKAGEWLIRCVDDHEHTWNGELEIERLGRLLGCEITVTIDQAALLAQVHRATIYRWIDLGQLPAQVSEGGATVVDKRDLALLTARKAAS